MHDVRSAHRVLERRDGGRAVRARERLRLRDVATGDADLAPVAHGGERPQRRIGLHTRTEHREHTRVLARE